MTDKEWDSRQGTNIALAAAVFALVFFIAIVLFVTGTIKIGPVEWYVLVMLLGGVFSADLAQRGLVGLAFICAILSAAWPAVITIVARMITGTP